MNTCQVCKKETKKSSNKYCSNKCQSIDRYNNNIKKWKSGGLITPTKNISRYIKRYLIEKYKNKCADCGWNERNLITGQIPLEVDRVNGNSTDNTEKNLRLICPNCHSLSPNFRNLNKGKGRSWRKVAHFKN